MNDPTGSLKIIRFIACLLPLLGPDVFAEKVRWVNGVGTSQSQSLGFYRSREALRIADTVLLYQRKNGGWPKNYDRTCTLSDPEKKAILRQKRQADTTFDNGSTHSELGYLARVYSARRNDQYKQAFLCGIEFVLNAQYKNGGWPQVYPANSDHDVDYKSHITFNDNAMINVMRILRDVAAGRPPYTFVDPAVRARCAEAVSKGIDCILKCQIEVQGQKTAWCAQHDEKSLAPQKARSYELASISGYASVGIVRFLMEIDNPSPETIQAVQQAITWFNHAKLAGIRVIKRADKSTPKGWDKILIQDPSAPPMWARFYEIQANQPIFCSRDGMPKDTLAEISYERRNGYSWLGYYATDLLKKDYPAWQKKWAPRENVLQK